METSKNNGCGLLLWLFAGLTTLLFAGLKLGGAIAWSWWWVFSPIFAMVGFILLLGLLIAVAASVD